MEVIKYVMCDHAEIVVDKTTGGSTCVNCSVYCCGNIIGQFRPGLIRNTRHQPVVSRKVSPSVSDILNDSFAIYDEKTVTLINDIFNITLNHKTVKEVNKRAITCASLYYGLWYLGKPKSFEQLINCVNVPRRSAMKGLKACQIAIQENRSICNSVDMQLLKASIHTFVPTYKENLLELLSSYNIHVKYFAEIENILVKSHLIKNRQLNDQSTCLWISCIFFWLLKINPYIAAEEFAGLNARYKITPLQLKLDVAFLEKHLG